MLYINNIFLECTFLKGFNPLLALATPLSRILGNALPQPTHSRLTFPFFHRKTASQPLPMATGGSSPHHWRNIIMAVSYKKPVPTPLAHYVSSSILILSLYHVGKEEELRINPFKKLHPRNILFIYNMPISRTVHSLQDLILYQSSFCLI